MSDKEVLEKAIQKAIGGGWPALNLGGVEAWLKLSPEKRRYHIDNMVTMGSAVASQSYPITIFNHDFAKALWGEEHDCGAGFHEKRVKMRVPAYKTAIGDYYIDGHNEELNLSSARYCLHGSPRNWQYHLQQMVIADDPIKYLGSHLGDQS